jgi:hypothetical protein
MDVRIRNAFEFFPSLPLGTQSDAKPLMKRHIMEISTLAILFVSAAQPLIQGMRSANTQIRPIRWRLSFDDQKPFNPIRNDWRFSRLMSPIFPSRSAKIVCKIEVNQ